MAWPEDANVVAQEAAKSWRDLWPNHCKHCGGWGGAIYPDTRHEPGGFDICEALPAEKCHRCGQDGLNEDSEGPCTVCGWNYDDGEPQW